MIVPHNRHCYTFLMQYNYDVWNRIQSIVYPDGETVSYHYSVGGKLNSIGTRKGSDTTEYVRKIDYNERGLKLRMVYRNGVSTRYTYDSILRLSNMNDGTMQDITYTYDKVGNILRIDNNGNVVNSLGGGYVNEYRYDSLYRLVRADGAFDTLNHHLRMTYSPAGRILSKSLTARLMDENTGVPTNVNYAYGYTYNNAKPHTVREVRDSYSNDMHLLEWDANGNLQYYYFKSPEMERWHCWDEDNRLQATSDNHNTAFYQYGADGNRALKLSGESQQMSNNGNYHYFAQLNQVTLYPSPHIVVDGHGYTKHYYADNERICSRIGGGGIEGLYLPTDSVTARMLKYKPAENAMQAAQAGQCAMASVSVPSNTLGIMADMQTVQSAENDIYFVHSDHLGSASWVTDINGQAIQHLQYLPYGESYIDQRSSTFHERYTFTGKEKDSESGYYYSGARYFMPNLSIWNSVDPMADKYPSLSPYNYCAWNPMKLVDPNGEDIEVVENGNGTYTIVGGVQNNDRNIYVVKNGKRTGEIIGRAFTKYSFFDDEGNIVLGATIDLNDNSGQDFIESATAGSINLSTYILDKEKGGRLGGDYDFKNRNWARMDDKNMTRKKYHNRGMVVSIKNEKTIASARDIGNYIAGYLSGLKGLSWVTACIGFDAYNMISNKELNGDSKVSREAERAGYRDGIRRGGYKNWIPFVK